MEPFLSISRDYDVIKTYIYNHAHANIYHDVDLSQLKFCCLLDNLRWHDTLKRKSRSLAYMMYAKERD